MLEMWSVRKSKYAELHQACSLKGQQIISFHVPRPKRRRPRPKNAASACGWLLHDRPPPLPTVSCRKLYLEIAQPVFLYFSTVFLYFLTAFLYFSTVFLYFSTVFLFLSSVFHLKIQLHRMVAGSASVSCGRCTSRTTSCCRRSAVQAALLQFGEDG